MATQLLSLYILLQMIHCVIHLNAQSANNQADDAMILWTSRIRGGPSSISTIPADPTLIKNISQASRTVYRSASGGSNLWSIASDKSRDLVFFADDRSDELGVHNLRTNVTTYHMHGMVESVEELAYDWATQNIYWTDSSLQHIVVTDRTFTYYAIIYRTFGDDEPFGLTLHAGKRLLIFSIYSYEQSEIVVTDMAGKNEIVILAYPQVEDVSILCIDYTDDRLYWTDQSGGFARVKSSKLDGTNVIEIYSKSNARFWGIAAYSDTIYLSDPMSYYNDEGRYHRLWTMSKNGKTTNQFAVTEMPKALSAYSDNQNQSRDQLSGECHTSPLCDHICLSRQHTKRECVCSMGYRKKGETGCITNLVGDNYMLIVDPPQKKVFQISLSGRQHSILPIATEKGRQISSLTLDSKSKSLFWFDKANNTIFKSDLNGLHTVKVLEGYHVKSMAVDPITGNVYFADGDTQYIYVMDRHGLYVKTLMMPSEDSREDPNIQMITLDLINKFVYWTSNNEIRRIKFDGSNHELVIRDLDLPQTITINHERESLFFVDHGNILHEIPFSAMTSVDGNMPTNKKLYSIPDVSQYDVVVDINIDNTTVYFIEEFGRFVRKFDLLQGHVSTKVGPDYFFHPRSISIFKASFKKAFLANQVDSCSSMTTKCRQLCIVMSHNTSSCACKDGMTSSGVYCTGNSVTDNPPSYEDTCPQDSQVRLLPCENTAQLNWKTPEWKDDITATSDLILSSPVIRTRYRPGRHEFLYTAVDGSGNVGHCQFTITVVETICEFRFPPVIFGVRVTTPACEDGKMVHYFRCTDSAKLVNYEDYRNKTIKNVCLDSGKWLISNINYVTCVLPSTSAMTSSGYTVSSAKTSQRQTTSSPAEFLPLNGTVAQMKAGVPASSLSSGAIAAIVICTVILLAILVGSGYVIVSKRRNSMKSFRILWNNTDVN